MALFEEQHEFSSIHIPISEMKEDLARQYRLYMQDGQIHEVVADSAADAVAKLGIKDGIVRIASAMQESTRMLQINILQPVGTSVATNISLEDTLKENGTVMIESREDVRDVEAFSLMNLVEYVALKDVIAPKEIADLFVDMDMSMVSHDILIKGENMLQEQEEQRVELAVDVACDEAYTVSEDNSADEVISSEADAIEDTRLRADEETVELAAEDAPVVREDSEEELALVAEYLQSHADNVRVEGNIVELSPEDVRNLLTNTPERQ